ncbi:GGDEF and EAL domain-containing protein [Synechococcus elongatus]|uniref:Diguanylate cyclase/phosphodiesterase with PAS/PAC sensor(S) n=1 Tax=Synechococcus elongatus (strain ATCC 33912 / PCC 7942 / FACHB-805) TaxID=1140 RepID=Q31MH3_SYNE7|nr:GGDEF and EAL domain-containing protein [Synechococcus elongatus]ABB57746.1 diguanylate cyclase/phosphodiesterase with PAS/PAC sensor(s) [Synechococcus elongatus PCC 7942 = FACHB-805]AJD57767.1 diguanylate cyclase [Synechococcus elongatus UTEX 2973]MBD2586461.1 EAL domain-containing protein [Synechococcus elongatus FACHB-242]MBD2687535.1 EAL domain-containing protein [Synechococcus elongatus FACHB-1061]MBD2706756.1 EAL domain-containing protein [Synechococcus elongatus PCC 7942 = FACHB-805]
MRWIRPRFSLWQHPQRALIIAVLYGAAGLLWILSTDSLLQTWLRTEVSVWQWSTLKEIFYFFLSAVVLYVLLRQWQILQTLRHANQEQRLQQLLHLLDGNPWPLWLVEPQTLRILDRNAAATAWGNVAYLQELAPRSQLLKQWAENPDALRLSLDLKIPNGQLRSVELQRCAYPDPGAWLIAARDCGDLQSWQQLTQVGYWELDVQSQLVQTSPLVNRLLGKPSDQCLFSWQQWLEHFQLSDRLRLEQAIDTGMQTGRPIQATYALASDSQDRQLVELRAVIVRDLAGNVRSLRGVLEPKHQAPLTSLEPLPLSLDHPAVLRRILEAIPDPIYIKDYRGEILLQNRACLDLQPFVMPEVIKQEDINDLATIASGLPIINEEWTINPENWPSQHFLISKVPLRNELGQILGLLGIRRNVTRWRRAEQARNALSDQLEQTLAAVSDGVVVLDQNFVVRALNSQAAQQLKKTSEQIIGRVFWDLFPVELGATLQSELQPLQHQSSTRTFELWIDPLSTCWEVNVHRSTAEISLYFRDISDRVMSRQLLEEMAERFQLVTRATNDAVWDRNLLTNEIWYSANYSRLFGGEEKEITQKLVQTVDLQWRDRLDPDQRERIMASLSGAIANGFSTWSEQYRFLRQDGTYAHVLDRGYIVRDENGRAIRAVGAMQDISAIVAANEQLRLWLRAIESTGNSIIIADAQQPDMPIIYVNPAFEKITGFSAAEVIGRNFRFLQGLETQQAELEEMRRALEEGTYCEVTLRSYRKDGSLFWNQISLAPVRDQKGHLTHMVASQTDVSESKAFEEMLLQQATHDALTGLPNRLLFLDRLDQAAARARGGGSPIAVLFIDLDNFKAINDGFSHSEGDAVLQIAAGRLQQCIQEHETVARLSSDEFVILLIDLDVQSKARVKAAMIQSLMAKPFEVMGNPIELTASIGVATFPHDGQSGSELLQAADLAVCAAKQQGKNLWCSFSEAMREQLRSRIDIEKDLRQALIDNSLELYFQPQVDLVTHRLLGFETLVRWNHPERGLVAPGEFIPIAEESDLIDAIGLWVMRAAGLTLRRWIDHEGFTGSLSFNISARQFIRQNIFLKLFDVLQEFQIPPHQLEIELTESSLIESPERFVQWLQEARSMGFQVALDDFGTGYSSLGYLKRLPINALKIDRSFIRDLPHDHDDQAIVQAIVAMAKVLKLRTIAEGVERLEQAAFLEAIGCDAVQGFFYGPPLPEAEALAFLHRSASPGV